jgi:hypothetical protein
VPHDDVGSIVSQPSARELPGTSERFVTNVIAISCVNDDAEQPRVTGGPTQRPRVVIIDFTDEQTLAPRIETGRRGSGFPERRGIELQILNISHVHAERVELRG